YITARVVGKPVSISEASIRSDLQFNDVVGIDVLPNQAIFDTIQLMGYEGDLNTLTFNKGLFSPQWKFLFHTIIHCLSSKSTSWDQIPTNIATVVICLATHQVYNFSKLIFDGIMRYLDAKKKFVMYPKFIPVFLTNQLKNVPVPLDHFPINVLTTKGFSFMVKKGKKNSGNVTPLFPSMLAQPTEDEDLLLTQFLIPFQKALVGIMEVTTQAAQINDLKAQIKQLKKNAKPVIPHHNAWIKSGRKPAKSEPTVHKDPAFDDLDDVMDYMETEDAHDEGTVKDSKEIRVSTKDQVSTDKLKVSTDKPNKGTAEPNEGTAKPKDGNSDESAAPTTIKDTNRPRTTTERSILTLKPLLKIDPKDKGKKVLEEKAKSDAELEGVNEAEKKAAEIRSRPPTRTQLKKSNDDIFEAGGRKHSNLKNKNFEKIQVLYAKVKSSDENFVAIGYAEDERIIRELKKKAAGTKKADSIKEKSKEEAGTRKRKLGTRKKMKSRKRRFRHGTSEDEKENDELKLCLKIAPDEDKEVDYEILDRKYPIKEWTTENLGIKPQFDETKGFDRVLWGDLMIMFNPNDEDEFWNTQQDSNIVSWKLHRSSGLESEEDSPMALEFIRFVKKLIAELEPEDSDGNEEDL
ncbi:hypothetical protein Tco_0664558, partial [Tanacetum coccineum]